MMLELPAYVRPVYEAGEISNRGELPLWSNPDLDPPPVGHIAIGKYGNPKVRAVVVGYSVEGGWLMVDGYAEGKPGELGNLAGAEIGAIEPPREFGVGLAFGLGQAVPAAAAAAWGARLIYPDDMLHDRQGFHGGHASEAGKALIVWLNGGAIAKAKEQARLFDNKWKISRDGCQKVILHEDDQGVVVANPQNSHGYLYIAGWLHNGDPALRPAPEFERVVIEHPSYEADCLDEDEEFDDLD